ncbi:TetR/AcrR family transcriptional regulator [Catellatospora bangladeshensis]|uniref:TetR family transcriptional regulator n=1 Tax=Catellatospora bangladeshensis TaxID=310355 RepID=A0A8J3JN79_9ACTN|nr:TetR family transcriptional regulator [Catellatospora bangladeshensis]GIF83678.1 TetR family transcriptional regulator [Catellatospora bangladeshensis]
MVARVQTVADAGETAPGGVRQAILEMARREIAEHGCSGASVRSIARAAEVDPRLVRHYYGSRENLLWNALSGDRDPLELAARLLRQSASTIGRRAAAAVFAPWEDPATADLQRARMAASLEGTEAVGRLESEFLSQLFGTIAASVSPDRPRLRAALAATHLTGVTVCRYLVGGPLAETDLGELVRGTGAALQRLLTGPLPEQA